MIQTEDIQTLFRSEYGESPQVIVRAPGRINLIGEHTDYNMGFVFPAAIDKSMYFAFRENGTMTCNLTAHDKEAKVSFDLDGTFETDKLWAKYCMGVIKEFQKKNITVSGFDCLFLSEIPIGAGVSSSAALECGFAKGIDYMANSQLANWDLATIGNQAENKFLGIQSGILDQFSSLFGKANQAMLMDCENKTFDYYDVDLDTYQIVLINTNVKHSHLSSGYNDRPSECAEVVSIVSQNYPEVKSLRDLTREQLEASENKLSPTLYNRASFILGENERVHAFKAALLSKDIEEMGRLLYSSHQGLKQLYEVSCKELDILVDLTDAEESIAGARMMGGGFGGCTLNLIHKEGMEEVISHIQLKYKQLTGIASSSYRVKIANGVEVL